MEEDNLEKKSDEIKGFRIDRRKGERREEERREEDRRREDRRKSERRETPRNGFDRRIGERRANSDRRFIDRRGGEERRVNNESLYEYDDVVFGRNSVLELLKSGKDINKIYIARGNRQGSIKEIIARAKEGKVVIVEVDEEKLNNMAKNNQGVVATVPPFDYCEVEDIIKEAERKKEDPFVLILEGMEDPHNLGSIIRTAETAGVHGIIIPNRRSVQVNSTVVKVSTGATSYVKIARVTNINDTIKKLKDMGLWVIGADASADTEYYNQNLRGPLAIIIGSEGFGMSKLVRENADILIKIPMKGKISSLNASVSAGIIIYEALRQRNV